MKQIAQKIFRETLAAIDVGAALTRKLARNGSIVQAGSGPVDLGDYRDTVAIAFGKASFAMAEALEKVLAPEFSVQGILVTPVPAARELRGLKPFVGGHPVPNHESFAAGRAILERLAQCDEGTLIFFLISGGGSALVEQPLDEGVTLADFQKLHSVLVTCGAPIEEINVIRKHLSATKGGRLAAAAPKSRKLTLAISDVPPGEESALASGPTVPDPTTIAEAERIVAKYALLEKFPGPIRRIFTEHHLRETPKPNAPVFERADFRLLLGEHDLTHAAHRTCEGQGYLCLCDTQADDWPLEKAADHLLGVLESHKKANPKQRVAVIADGEVVSPVTGNGKGGRNSAFVLTCLPRIAGKNIAVLSAGTDGIDGNSPAAGAVADGQSMACAKEAGLDPSDFLLRSDAYNFFSRLGDAIVTGPTGNNLRDLRILLAE